MSPTDNTWIKMDNFKGLEKNIKTVLTCAQKNDRLKNYMAEVRNKQVISAKHSKTSEHFRELGNQQYLKCDDSYYIHSAIELFTKSIAYAPLRSTELSLAYANRSALLMKARLYDDAIVDIGRAMKTGYPDRLKAKLFLRRALCLKAINPTAESDIEKALENARGWLRRMDKKSPSRQIVTDTLNDLNKMAVLPPPRTKWNAKKFLTSVFEENPEIIDASSSIAIKSMENNEFGIVATKDIQPGEIISAQEPYVALLHEDRRYTHCWHCHDQTLSAIPCNYCAFTIFCSETCRDAAWSEYHSIECKILATSMLVSLDIAQAAVSMRMIIRAVKEAGSIQALKKFIQKIESDPDLKRKGFTGSKFDGSKLSSIYGLPTHDDTWTPHDFGSLMSTRSLIVVFSLATLSNFFGEKMTHEKFYRHEYVPFITAVLIRFLLISRGTLQDGYDTMDSLTKMDHTLMMVPLHSHIAHNCLPNVSTCVFGSKVVIYAHHPIKRGEQIFQCRGLMFERSSEKKRKAEIIQSFECSSWSVARIENWSHTDSPQCNFFRVPEDPLFGHEALLETIDGYTELSMRRHFAVIAKLINDLSITISDLWNCEGRNSRELAQAVTLLNKIFFMLGNRRKFF